MSIKMPNYWPIYGAPFYLKKGSPETARLCPTDDDFLRFENNPSILADVREEVSEITKQYNFFHWHLAFPEVFNCSMMGIPRMRLVGAVASTSSSETPVGTGQTSGKGFSPPATPTSPMLQMPLPEEGISPLSKQKTRLSTSSSRMYARGGRHEFHA